MRAQRELCCHVSAVGAQSSGAGWMGRHIDRAAPDGRLQGQRNCLSPRLCPRLPSAVFAKSSSVTCVTCATCAPLVVIRPKRQTRCSTGHKLCQSGGSCKAGGWGGTTIRNLGAVCFRDTSPVSVLSSPVQERQGTTGEGPGEAAEMIGGGKAERRGSVQPGAEEAERGPAQCSSLSKGRLSR